MIRSIRLQVISILLIFIFITPALSRGKKDDENTQYKTSADLEQEYYNSKSTPLESDEKTKAQAPDSLPETNVSSSPVVKSEQPTTTTSTIVLLPSLPSLEVPLCPATCSIPSAEIVDHEVHAYTGFELCYRESYEEAEWVAYCLTKEELTTVIDRTNDFRADSKITTGSATPQDYSRSGYDRGHLAPAADMEWSERSAHDSFLMSNMTPQSPQFNRGMWKDLEEQVRAWAGKFGAVYVVTGPILEKSASSYNHIGQNHVAVPEFFYKVLLAQLDDNAHTIIGTAFILPNKKCEGTIADYQTTIDEVEKRTGVDFFATLPNEIENPVEAQKDTADWQ